MTLEKRKTSRDGFLDAIRAIATIRVVLWHTFAAPFLSFFVASMPTMFFVAGSLFAASLNRRPFRVVLRDRLRRLLVPFWLFGMFAFSVFVISARVVKTAATTFEPGNVIGWLFPIIDPKGTHWEAGWISQPLWYLRALVWLMIAAPLLRRTWRSIRLYAFIAPTVLVFVVDYFVRVPTRAPSWFSADQWFGSVRWYVGDFALYSIFFMAGFAHRDGAFRSMSTKVRIEWMMIAAGAAGLWCATQPVIGGVVNNSYPAHLLVGFAWLFAFLAIEPKLRNASTNPIVSPILQWFTQRSLTVYLWHTVAIVGADWLLGKFTPNAPRILVLPILVVLVPAIATITGWAEDLAAGRRMRMWPVARNVPTRRSRWSTTRGSTRPVFAATGILSLGLIMLGSQFAIPTGAPTAAAAAVDTARRRPAPSARPEPAVFALADSTIAPTASSDPKLYAHVQTTIPALATQSAVPATDTRADRLALVVDTWRDSLDVAGATVAISFPDGSTWSGGSGSMQRDDPIEVTSVTKSFTAALILRLADKGLLDIDAPVPALAKVPEFPTSAGITPRQLMNHSSGLGTYQDSDEFKANPKMMLTPEAAVRMASKMALISKPGVTSGYSSSGYLTLGLLAEQVGGATLREQFQKEFFTPLGLLSARLDPFPPTEGWIGWSTGGVQISMSDLAKWGVALLRNRSVLSSKASAEMVNIDNDWSVGLGAWPICPCVKDKDNHKTYTSIGHSGGSGTIQFSPEDQLVIAASISEPFFNGRITQQDLFGLLTDLRSEAAKQT
jgi:CubicO group peptidase (beta-lactamase class C family)/peptidoglycan/LPS O-acetylase OafA/YrhL